MTSPPNSISPHDRRDDLLEVETRLGREVFIRRMERELRLHTHLLEPHFDAVVFDSGEVATFVLKCLGLKARGLRNALDIRIETHEAVLPGLSRELDGYRVLQFSDLHFENNPRVTDRLVELLPGVEYDLAVMTGDYRARTWGAFELAMHELERLRSAIEKPVYAVLGNHDSVLMIPWMRRMGLPVLFNEGVRVERGAGSFYLAGIDDPHYHRAWDLGRALQDRRPGEPCVLLAHSNRAFRQAEAAGVSLLLCGHSHGGQLCLPGGFPLRNNTKGPRRMVRGPWRHGRLCGYTSRGAGVTGVAARFNCPPEITVHILRSPDA